MPWERWSFLKVKACWLYYWRNGTFNWRPLWKLLNSKCFETKRQHQKRKNLHKNSSSFHPSISTKIFLKRNRKMPRTQAKRFQRNRLHRAHLPGKLSKRRPRNHKKKWEKFKDFQGFQMASFLYCPVACLQWIRQLCYIKSLAGVGESRGQDGNFILHKSVVGNFEHDETWVEGH